MFIACAALFTHVSSNLFDRNATQASLQRLSHINTHTDSSIQKREKETKVKD